MIISDDGSRDGSDAILARFEDRITLLRNSHRGVAAARNAGWQAASGDFVLYADADDIVLPGKIAALQRLGGERPDLDLLATDMYFEQDGRRAGRFGKTNPFPLADQRRTVLERCFVVQPAIRRSRLEKVGGFDERLKSAVDWDCILRLVLAGSEAGLVDAPLAVYRIHTGSLAGARVQSLRDRVTLLEKASTNRDLRPEERPTLERSLAVQRRERAGRGPGRRRRGRRRCSAALPQVVVQPGGFGPGPALRDWRSLCSRAGSGGGPAAGSRPLPALSKPSRSRASQREEAMSPAVSIVMAVYNGERFLRDAIESVLAESFRDLELVVLDDGSTDATPRILAEYAAADPRVRVHREEGDNLAQALNRCVTRCQAPLLARLDSDDISISGRLEAQVGFMQANPRVVLLGGQAELIDEEGSTFATAEYPTGDAELRRALQTINPFVHSAIVMRRAAFDAAGGYRENLPHSEDLDLWLRLAGLGGVANLPRPLVKYRIHSAQQSLQKQRDQAVHSVATRMAARARAAGEPDPLEDAARIDEDFLLANGTDPHEISKGIVTSACWLGRTSGRAGYAETEKSLLAAAYEEARSEAGSPALLATVHRSVSRRHAEQGHWLRAKLKTAQAAIAEKR